jgi:hypothetical protein
MNRTNLEKLAAYLEQLPEDYAHFGMEYYMFNTDGQLYSLNAAPLLGTCGTVACAIGHGPAAGIPANEGLWGWCYYGVQSFKLSESEFDWCFESRWALIDDTPHGAAKRIRYLLEHGEPDDAVAQMQGRAPYLFAKEVSA